MKERQKKNVFFTARVISVTLLMFRIMTRKVRESEMKYPVQRMTLLSRVSKVFPIYFSAKLSTVRFDSLIRIDKVCCWTNGRSSWKCTLRFHSIHLRSPGLYLTLVRVALDAILMVTNIPAFMYSWEAHLQNSLFTFSPLLQ